MQPKFVPVILAGGKGERFWPLSRKHRPKQFLCLDGSGESLMQATANRLMRLTYPRGDVKATNHEGETRKPILDGWNDIWVITSELLATGVQAQLPSLMADNLLVEPEGRDTAAAVAWASLEIAKRYGDDVVIGFFPADAWIGDVDGFARTIEAAVQLADDRGAIVTLGITPTFPAIGYGYIQQGVDSGEYGYLKTYQALRFTEKPDLETAKNFIASGDYTWNSGIFIFTAAVAIKELRTYSPELMQQLTDQGVSGYATLPKISIDYALMEKTQLTHVIPAEFGWDDLGDWNAIERLMKGDDINVELANHVCIETQGSVIYASNPNEVVVTIGLEDLVVVRDGDVTLIVAKHRTQEIKQVLNKIKENKELDRLL
jgi:mannose-1-phosphate guanylyltransferase